MNTFECRFELNEMFLSFHRQNSGISLIVIVTSILTPTNSIDNSFLSKIFSFSLTYTFFSDIVLTCVVVWWNRLKQLPDVNFDRIKTTNVIKYAARCIWLWCVFWFVFVCCRLVIFWRLYRERGINERSILSVYRAKEREESKKSGRNVNNNLTEL